MQKECSHDKGIVGLSDFDVTNCLPSAMQRQYVIAAETGDRLRQGSSKREKGAQSVHCLFWHGSTIILYILNEIA